MATFALDLMKSAASYRGRMILISDPVHGVGVDVLHRHVGMWRQM